MQLRSGRCNRPERGRDAPPQVSERMPDLDESQPWFVCRRLSLRSFFGKNFPIHMPGDWTPALTASHSSRFVSVSGSTASSRNNALAPYRTSDRDALAYARQVIARQDLSPRDGVEGEFQKRFKASLKRHRSVWTMMTGATTVASGKMFTTAPAAARIRGQSGRVAELADAKDLGSFGAILAGSTPVAPTNVGVG